MSISDNGQYMAFELQGYIPVIELQQGKIIAQKYIVNLSGYTNNISLSYSGKYLAVLAYDEEGCLPYSNYGEEVFVSFYDINESKGTGL